MRILIHHLEDYNNLPSDTTAHMFQKLALFLLLNLTNSSIGNTQIDSMLRRGNLLYESQHYADALRLYDECIALDPARIDCYEKAGTTAKVLGEHPKAKELFLKLEVLDDSNTIALRQLAALYEQEQNIPKAIKYYSKLILNYPDNGIYFRKLGQLYGEAKLKRESLANYVMANKLNPRDLMTLKGMAEFHLTDKKYATADSLLLTALQMDSLNIRLNILMANSQFRQKNYVSTAIYMEKIRGKFVLKPYHQKMLGYAYMQIDSFDRAIYHLNQALTNEGTKEYAHYNLAVAHESKGDVETAKYHFMAAIKAGISDDMNIYHRNLARLYNMEEDLKAAIPHYKDAYKYSEDPLLLFFLARASDQYYKDKNIAIRYYGRFMGSDYKHIEYQDYSAKRTRYLKEELHLSKE